MSVYPDTKTGAALNRGRSRQDYGTPRELLDAVRTLFGPLAFDLAASPDNAVSSRYFTAADDALAHKWAAITCRPGEYLWLNPPFAHIEPWVKKCVAESARVLLLVPASVGADWWRDYVHQRGRVSFLNGRVKFVGATDYYPRDCALVSYADTPRYDVWSWRS